MDYNYYYFFLFCFLLLLLQSKRPQIGESSQKYLRQRLFVGCQAEVAQVRAAICGKLCYSKYVCVWVATTSLSFLRAWTSFHLNSRQQREHEMCNELWQATKIYWSRSLLTKLLNKAAATAMDMRQLQHSVFLVKQQPQQSTEANNFAELLPSDWVLSFSALKASSGSSRDLAPASTPAATLDLDLVFDSGQRYILFNCVRLAMASTKP